MFSIMKIDLPPGDNDYLIFESIKSAPAKVIHVFDLSSCDDKARVHDKQHYSNNDFSVSRVHSFIRVCADELILQDNGSKFGTLIKLARPTELLCA